MFTRIMTPVQILTYGHSSYRRIPRVYVNTKRVPLRGKYNNKKKVLLNLDIKKKIKNSNN